jgi:glycine cleavage system aminomethyltransferase T
MSRLAFLSTDATSDSRRTPVARSPMYRQQRDRGARFETRHGWELAVTFPNEAAMLQTVGIMELPQLGKFDVRGAGARPSAMRSTWYQITPQRALCIADAPDAARVGADLERSARRVVDVSSGLGSLALLGPRAGELLRRITDLEVFPASGMVCHVHGHILTIDGGFLLLLPQEYGHYLYEVLLDAALPCDGGPIGVDAVAGGIVW